jgi:hypothetical protein
MRNGLINFCKNNSAFSIFCLMIGILSIGMIATSGFSHIDKLAFVAVAFVLTYFLVKRMFPLRNNGVLVKPFEIIGQVRYLNEALFVVCLGLFALDMFTIGAIPVFQASSLKTVKELTELRANIHSDSSTVLVYITSWNLKALIPFALLHFYYVKRKWFFYILLCLGSFYSLALMQKSFIFSVLTPITIYMIIKRNYLHLLVLVGVLLTTLFILTAQLSHLVESDESYTNKPEEPTNWTTIPKGLAKRVFIVPGEMVSLWFSAIPDQRPFLYGDGYNLIAKMKGHRFVDYNEELYPLFRPEYTSQGLKGTVNVASFVREYSNFGYAGLVIAAVFLASFLYFLERLFVKNKLLFISLNAFPILLLSSSNVLTILFSGGWAVIIVLYLIFKPQYQEKVICAE